MQPLSPVAENIASPASAVSVADICLSWRKALDGYDAAGERRRLADLLRARGENPSRCESGGNAVPLSPGISGEVDSGRAEGVRRDTSGRRATKMRVTRQVRMKSALECTSELVEGPPARYKTICR